MTKSTSELLGQLKIDRNAESEPRTFSVRSALIFAFAAAAAGILIGALASAQFGDTAPAAAQTTLAPPASAPETQTVTKVDLAAPAERPAILNASGYITARRMATVSAEVMGLIASVEVEEGMQVSAGQVLARIDDALARVNLQFAQAQVKVLQSRVNSIKANLAEAERQQLRYAGLMDKNYSSRAQLTQSQASVQSLQADLASAHADIEVTRLEVDRQRERLADHTIRAPFSGVVTQKNAQPGEIVAPSSAGGGFTRTGICTIVDMDSLEIEVDVNEAFIGRVTAGQKVSANLDAYPQWDIPATVIAIIPTADRAKATVRVRIGIDEKDARILPDMGVKVAFLKD
jgi:RND family efflux transporter MFP subunit